MLRTILSRLYILFHFIVRTIYIFVLTIIFIIAFAALKIAGNEKRPKLLKWYPNEKGYYGDATCTQGQVHLRLSRGGRVLRADGLIVATSAEGQWCRIS